MQRVSTMVSSCLAPNDNMTKAWENEHRRTAFTCSPHSSDVLLSSSLIAYDNQLRHTSNGAISNWSNKLGGHADYHDVVWHPTNSNIAFVANDGGVFKLTISSNSSQFLGNGLGIATQYHVASDKVNGYDIVCGHHDDGTDAYTGSLSNWSHIGGGDGMRTSINTHAAQKSGFRGYGPRSDVPPFKYASLSGSFPFNITTEPSVTNTNPKVEYPHHFANPPYQYEFYPWVPQILQDPNDAEVTYV